MILESNHIKSVPESEHLIFLVPELKFGHQFQENKKPAEL